MGLKSTVDMVDLGTKHVTYHAYWADEVKNFMSTERLCFLIESFGGNGNEFVVNDVLE